MNNLPDPSTLLPHGTEFRFVDQLTALDPGKSASATYTLRGDEHFLRGHFPGNPIIPGVVLIEAAAQLGGIAAQTDPEIPPMADLRLTAVRNAKILGTATPGETLTIHATLDARLGNLAQLTATITNSETPILKCQLTLSGTLNGSDPSAAGT
ncbi:MAG: beta-hydroxyacyl-ACP dehydratase [Verrucomicrobiales bacterium]|nr:beta-hydroxyacyl-ACP dehydratase [Verrucomicrobiales bacterium]